MTQKTEITARLCEWSQIAEYVDGGYAVYYRHENRQVVRYNGKCAIIDANTGELQEPDINLLAEKARAFHVKIPVGGKHEISPVKVVVPNDVMYRLSGSMSRAVKEEARILAKRKHHKRWFEDGQTQPSRKREGQGKSIALVGFYVNQRGAFTVDEFSAVHDRFKAHAAASHAKAMAKLRTKTN